jgi:hypothetical protein
MSVMRKKLVLVPYTDYIAKFKNAIPQQQQKQQPIIQTSGEVVLPGRTFTDHVHDLGKTSIDILNKDEHTPEVQLKLFDFLNKMYSNSTRQKLPVVETESSIDVDKAAVKKEEENLLVNLAVKALPKTRRSNMIALMMDLLARNIVTIDSKGYLGHPEIASKQHINDFLRVIAIRNLNIDAEMEYFLRAIIAYIPPGHITNPKFNILRTRLIGSGNINSSSSSSSSKSSEDGGYDGDMDDEDDDSDWEQRRKEWNGWLRY